MRPIRGISPSIHTRAWVAETAVIVGDVQVGENSTVWYNAVLRGDVMPIRIGRETNIQDGSVVHGTYKKFGVTVGDRVTIGHSVILHGCTIGNNVLVGMGSVVMDGAEIGESSIVGAGSLVTQGSKFPPQSLILGRPAKAIRTLTEAELKHQNSIADYYLEYKKWYENPEEVSP